MIEEIDFETYLYVSKNKYKIFLFDKMNIKNLYKNKLELKNPNDFIDLKSLSEFLDDNIFKIEKLIGKFIKNIFLIIENDKNFHTDICIKKKNYENSINQKYLEYTLSEIKDLFKENYLERNIMHMLINNYLINGKNYSSFKSDLSIDHLCLEVNFISISNDLTFAFDKVLEKYQIKIIQYLDGYYLKKFFKDDDIELSEMAYKLRDGHNENEVILVPKNIENKGFFEKFFQLFS
tara:strand:- start:206 stop:910 length:705 start_codon:yes stop_codon:yes gene_type:complete